MQLRLNKIWGVLNEDGNWNVYELTSKEPSHTAASREEAAIWAIRETDPHALTFLRLYNSDGTVWRECVTFPHGTVHSHLDLEAVVQALQNVKFAPER